MFFFFGGVPKAEVSEIFWDFVKQEAHDFQQVSLECGKPNAGFTIPKIRKKGGIKPSPTGKFLIGLPTLADLKRPESFAVPC